MTLNMRITLGESITLFYKFCNENNEVNENEDEDDIGEEAELGEVDQ